MNLGKTDKANVRGRGGMTVLKILQKMLTHSGDTDLLQNRPLGSSLRLADATADSLL